MKKVRETVSLILGGISAMLLIVAMFFLGANDLSLEGCKLVVSCIFLAAAFGYGSWRLV